MQERHKCKVPTSPIATAVYGSSSHRGSFKDRRCTKCTAWSLSLLRLAPAVPGTCGEERGMASYPSVLWLIFGSRLHFMQARFWASRKSNAKRLIPPCSPGKPTQPPYLTILCPWAMLAGFCTPGYPATPPPHAIALPSHFLCSRLVKIPRCYRTCCFVL